MVCCGQGAPKLDSVESDVFALLCVKLLHYSNTGAGSKAAVMKLCGITSPGAPTMKAFREQDRVRVKAAAKKISVKYRERRRKLRAQRKEKGDQNAYQPGGFGLSSKPLVEVNKKKRAVALRYK